MAAKMLYNNYKDKIAQMVSDRCLIGFCRKKMYYRRRKKGKLSSANLKQLPRIVRDQLVGAADLDHKYFNDFNILVMYTL